MNDTLTVSRQTVFVDFFWENWLKRNNALLDYRNLSQSVTTYLFDFEKNSGNRWRIHTIKSQQIHTSAIWQVISTSGDRENEKVPNYRFPGQVHWSSRISFYSLKMVRIRLFKFLDLLDFLDLLNYLRSSGSSWSNRLLASVE